MKQLFIMRGLPGSGKSHIARIIQKALEPAVLYLSADDLRMTDEGYKFLPELEPYVWEEFERLFFDAINTNTPNIIVDNTNLRQIVYAEYKELAEQNGYMVHEIIVGDFNVLNSYNRSIHEVPLDKIQGMKDLFEFPS